MKKETKLISFHSPLGQVGQTSIINMVGLELAKQGYYVVILELSRYTGFSLFLNKGLGTFSGDLKSCLVDPSRVKDNIISSKHNGNLFYICQNFKNTASDLLSYNSENIDNIITNLLGVFDYIFIDLPSDINDPATVRVLSGSFKYDIDQSYVVVDENVLAMKKLNDYDNIISRSTLNVKDKKNTTLIVNKSNGRYSPFFEPYLAGLPYTRIVNIVNVLDVPEFRYICNEGNIMNLGRTSEAKEFYKSINIISNIVMDNSEGFGVAKLNKKSRASKKLSSTSLNKSLGKSGKKLKKGKSLAKKKKPSKKFNKEKKPKKKFGTGGKKFGKKGNK